VPGSNVGGKGSYSRTVNVGGGGLCFIKWNMRIFLST
jgi:hypothetical protein